MRSQALLILIVFCLCIDVYGQSKQSDALYAHGVELYRAERYGEAAVVFEKAMAIDTVEIDSLKVRRKSCEEWIASSYYMAGDLENAKRVDRFGYDVPPTDRRLTIESDSLYDKAMEEILVEHKPKEAIPLLLRTREKQIEELGGDTWVSISTSSILGYVYSYVGMTAEAEHEAQQAIDDFVRLYGSQSRSKALLMRNACDVFCNTANIEKYHATLLQLMDFLTSIGEVYGEFAREMLDRSYNIYSQAGDMPKFDAVVEMLKRLVTVKYGVESKSMCTLLSNAAQTNLKLGRRFEALSLANQLETVALKVEGHNGEHLLISKFIRGTVNSQMMNLRDARKELNECLKISRHIDNPSLVGTVISCIMMLQNAEGKKMSKKLLAEVMGIMESMLLTPENVKAYSATTLLVARALSVNQHTHEAATIVYKNLETYECLNLYSNLFGASLILLNDRQIVNARKACSKGLEILSKELDYRLVAVTANEAKVLIDAGLRTVSNIKRQEKRGMDTDTIGYSLGMIKQDLLRAKLAIYAHTDSFGTRPFMETLSQFIRTVTVYTKDMLMADSIISLYSAKLQETFGCDAPQCQELEELKLRYRFELTSKGNSLASVLEVPKLIGIDYLYDSEEEEYEAAFVAWKADGGKKDEDTKRISKRDYEIYKVPYIGRIKEQRRFKTVADSCVMALRHCEALIDSVNAETDDIPYSGYIERVLEAWCLCADSLGFRQQVVPQLVKWAAFLTKHRIASNGESCLMALSLAKLYGDTTQYEELEKKLSETIKDHPLELRAAVLIKTIRHIGGLYYSWEDKSLAEQVLHELDETLKNLEKLNSARDITYQKLFMTRSMYLWYNYRTFNYASRTDLLADFLKIYDMLSQTPALHEYEESYDAMNMLCSITTDYSVGDDALTLEADRLRRTIQKARSEKVQSKLKDGTLTSVFSIGNDFSLYAGGIGFPEDESDELERKIRYVYIRNNLNYNGSSQEQYETLQAVWNTIRYNQKSTYTDNKELTDMIEKLTDKVCQYLQDKNVSDTIRGIAYDIALFGKGYLLRSQQQLHKVIQQSGSRTALAKYDEYIRLQQRLDGSTLSESEYAQLREKEWSLWHDLRSSSSSFDDHTKFLETSWRDVRAALADNEIAIEYIHSSKEHYYYALILRKDYDAPIVKLVGWDDNFKTNIDTLYTIGGKYRSLWPFYVSDKNGKTIYPFQGIKRIYVSPAGFLHQLSLESVYDISYTDSLMSEKYEIYRVSSTRELIKKHKRTALWKAELYGGVTYNLNESEWQQLALDAEREGQLTAMRDAQVMIRGAVVNSIQPLGGTEHEVREISKVLSANSIQVDCQIGVHATEGHLKKLSSSDVSLLHIATHGFYQTAETVSAPASITFERKGDNREASALSRSGLLLAGAAAIFDGSNVPDNVDDGVLTAREISHLDLSNVDLVVLSACETGLGDITSDGVYGLQRGFKKAGAQSILMSLWKVDDEATCILMTEFYRNWIGEKKTKREALELAKQSVRSHKEKGWDDPKYWAAFILLDALD